MPQVFHPSANTLSRVVLFSLVVGPAALLGLVYLLVRSPYQTQVRVIREQPVQFSHEHHVNGLGIDCRFCHTSVETASAAGMPATHTCMTCHSQIWADSPLLEPVRASLKNQEPLAWSRVHDLPDFVYFHHGIHVQKGVGCVECHGRIDKMPLAWREKPLTMEWCLECHRNPVASTASQGRRLRDGLGAPRGQRARAWRRAPSEESYGGRPVDELLDLSSMNPSKDDVDKPLTLSELMRGAQSVSETESQGPRYWRSLSELADDGSFTDEVAQAVAGVRGAIEGLDDASRRRFMKLMGASFALAGVAGCSVQPVEKIVPYVEQPESIVPGKPMFFATASALGGDGVGLLVESQMGRPIKIEGNPTHPASQGATDVFSQAEILSLYDPDRSQVVIHDGRTNTWERFLSFAVDLREKKKATKGGGLRVLTRTVTSPTLADQIQKLLKEMPEARWHSYEPVTRDNVRKGAELAFGEPLEPVYDFAKADVVVTLDADFLSSGPGRLRYARAFADRRASARSRGPTRRR